MCFGFFQKFVFQKILLGDITSVLIPLALSIKSAPKPETTFLNARETFPTRVSNCFGNCIFSTGLKPRCFSPVLLRLPRTKAFLSHGYVTYNCDHICLEYRQVRTKDVALASDLGVFIKCSHNIS